MNPKLTHYIQGICAIIEGSALTVMKVYPQWSTPALLVGGIALVVHSNLGLFSGSAMADDKKEGGQ